MSPNYVTYTILRGEHPEESHEKRSFGFHPQDDIALHRGISPTRHCETRSVEAIQVRDTSGSVLSMTNRKKKAAFTLAEVLITLGIIGIVAAMTLPAVINTTRNKELETGLKRSYSLILQAFDMYQAETGERITIDNTEYRTLKSKIMPYFKVLADCRWGFQDTEAKNDTVCFTNPAEGLEPQRIIKTYNNSNSYVQSTGYFDDGQFVLSDGSLILIENQIQERLYISVDVNGIAKRPNRWGHDIFTFQVMPNGKILPMGADGTDFEGSEYCSITSANMFNGAGCTYKALSEPDFFKNLPK